MVAQAEGQPITATGPASPTHCVNPRCLRITRRLNGRGLCPKCATLPRASEFPLLASPPRSACLECRERHQIPGRRGLCCRCFGDLAIRTRYPKRFCVNSRQGECWAASDAEILAMPASPIGDYDTQPPAQPYREPKASAKVGVWLDNWQDVIKPLIDFELTPDTSPEAIAAVQREDIAQVLAKKPRATVEELSSLTVLPKWTVERRLAEIKLAKKAARRRKVKAPA